MYQCTSLHSLTLILINLNNVCFLFNTDHTFFSNRNDWLQAFYLGKTRLYLSEQKQSNFPQSPCQMYQEHTLYHCPVYFSAHSLNSSRNHVSKKGKTVLNSGSCWFSLIFHPVFTNLPLQSYFRKFLQNIVPMWTISLRDSLPSKCIFSISLLCF